MRLSILYITILLPLISISQNINKEVILKYDGHKDSQIIRTDSFIFCGKQYKISRDCKKRNESNCCSYKNNPDQVGCYNGTSLFWHEFKTMEAAYDFFISYPSQLKQQLTEIEKRGVVCKIVGIRSKGLLMHYKTKEGQEIYKIISYGKVNGHIVFIELSSLKKLRNNKIQPMFRQIIKLSV